MCNFEIFTVNRGDDELSNETKYETIRQSVDFLKNFKLP